MNRAEHALAWVSLLGMSSLASTGAWADYVPLTCVWMLTLLVPIVAGRRALRIALIACGTMQVTLIGTMPIGNWTDMNWMIPVSLLGAVAMLASFCLRHSGKPDESRRDNQLMTADGINRLAVGFGPVRRPGFAGRCYIDASIASAIAFARMRFPCPLK